MSPADHKFDKSRFSHCNFLKSPAGAELQSFMLLQMPTHADTLHTHRSYTESNGERCEVGRQQTEGHMKVVDEAILHVTGWRVLHKCTAVCSTEVHHMVTLNKGGNISFPALFPLKMLIQEVLK